MSEDRGDYSNGREYYYGNSYDGRHDGDYRNGYQGVYRGRNTYRRGNSKVGQHRYNYQGGQYPQKYGRSAYPGYYGREKYNHDNYYPRQRSTEEEAVEENFSWSGDSTPSSSHYYNGGRTTSSRGRQNFSRYHGQAESNPNIAQSGHTGNEGYGSSHHPTHSSPNMSQHNSDSYWVRILQIKDERTKSALNKSSNALQSVDNELRELQKSKRALESSLKNLETQYLKESLHVQLTNEKLEELSYI